MKKDRAFCLSVTIVSALILASMCVSQAFAQVSAQQSAQPQVIGNAVANEPTYFDISRPLSQMVARAPTQQVAPVAIRSVMRPKLDKLQAIGQPRPGAAAAAFSTPLSPLISAKVGLSFDGVGNTSVLNCPSVAGITVAPPDTNAAVGDTQVVEWVNLCYSVFDKSTGALLAGPFAGNAFWNLFGGQCQLFNDGDIIIQWDKANHRWLASQNVFSPPYTTCVAVSQSADATGSYYRYAFFQPGFPDYPKWGLTPTVYYQTQNMFGFGPIGFGVNVCAYDATAMLAGSPTAKQICIFDDSNGTAFDDNMLPADSDSIPNKKTKTTGEVLLGAIDNVNPGGHVYEYVFTANFKKPSNSTLAGVNGSMPIAVPTYFLGCGGFAACIPQPSPGSELLDSLGDRLMYRLARFDDGTNQHFLVNHSVNNTTGMAARWYEFRAPTGSTSLSLYQSGETPDDGEYRWMGSVAYDKAGDIALGYSRSSAAAGDYPSIYYSGQTTGDPRGTTEPEALIVQGSGSQFFTADRWGDYSSMALDGNNSCTFWYAQEYYPVDGSFAWATWLASLKFPNCH
jgi:hypothetical protein